MHTIITYFSDPTWWDIGHIHSWAVAALAYAIVTLLIARYVGTKQVPVGTTTRITYEGTDTLVPSVPLTPHEQLLFEERIASSMKVPLPAPYKDGVPHPNSPAHHYHPSPKHTHTDINMDDPDWVRTLEDELS